MKIKASITSAFATKAIPAKSYALGLALSLCAFGAAAAPEPYANAGTENNVEYSFTATTSGDIVAYFAGKGGAVYYDSLSMSVNGVETDVFGLSNQSSTYGESFVLGSANAGDTIVFSLKVLDTGSTWYSAKSQNSDGSNHIFSSAFAGEGEEGGIPSGVYLAFEDLAKANSDFNYLDEQFVIANVTANTNTPEVPVPAAAWLFGSGLLGLGGIARRRSSGI